MEATQESTCLAHSHRSASSVSTLFWNVSLIDHGVPEPEAHAGCITAPFIALTGAMMTMLRPRRALNGQTRPMLARIANCPSGFDIRTFERPACDHVHHQRVVETVDPMKSRETAGWLRGELRAPT